MFKFIAIVMETINGKKEVIIKLVRTVTAVAKRVAEAAPAVADTLSEKTKGVLGFVKHWMVKAAEMAASQGNEKVKALAETTKKIAETVVETLEKGVEVANTFIKKVSEKVSKVCSWFETAFSVFAI